MGSEPLRLDPHPDRPAASRLATSATLSSLRTLALLCVVLPAVGYGLVGAYRYHQIRADIDLRLDRALRIAHEHALKVLDTNESFLARVLDATGAEDAAALQAREAMLHDQLRAMSLNKPQIEAIWIFDAQGRPLVSDRRYPAPRHIDITDRDYFKWHQAGGGGLYVSRPLIGKITGDRFFDMSRARTLPDGRFDGVVSIGLAPSYFEKFHSDLVADEPGLAITMLREDGSIFTRWPLLAGAPTSLSANSPVMSRIRAGETSARTVGVSSVDGRERLLMFNKLADYPVYIGTGMDVGDITQRWAKEMAGLAAFGLPPLLGLLLALRVALRRTRDVLQAAERLDEEAQARRRVEEALLQSQKLEALGRLTGGVAHDFNNALMVISNNLFLLKRKHPEADGPQVESIGRAVGNATKLTRQLLAFSRRQALVPQYLRLQDVLPQLKDLIAPVLGSQVQLSVQVAPDTQSILVDSAEFELALINLAINARDAMSSAGSFSLQARNAAELPPLLEGPMVVVEASDTGSGMTPEVLARVFEPFFTTKPVGQGTGLGLSQIYGLCQRAGGLADIQSQPGAGTRVRLFFPAVQSPASTDEDGALSAHRDLGKAILLVEDNDEVAAALRPVLESLGCSVTRLDRAATARDWLHAQATLPDVLLTDVVMPGEMDGAALAQYARATFPQLKIVLMTGYAEQIDAIARQGFVVIPKPCSPDMLADAITRARPAGEMQNH